VRSEARFPLPPVARHVAVKTIGSFVPGLTRKAFEKFGFSTATLIMDWSRIAGAELAASTQPERLKWPRGGEGWAEEEDGATRRGATLHLRVDPARALEVEYRARQIVDRINAYFGYRAVETIRLVQAPLARPAPSHKPAQRAAPQVASARPAAKASPNADDAHAADALAAALARMERAIQADAARRRA